ncbi:hypothetical protein GOBAR_AA09076 [Gossypium barbadense]|uniref:Transcription initiation factor IIF subunit alpha n=1 Tax=Gossypium barbadense TaxID=3634 RepID=A0A2P5Y7J4_GOSBA|nr:hypothetical protein GOBAR_AA09076 [Gossypium barbadense]
MSFDLMLKPSCSGCGSSQDLYGSNCKHMTLCVSCGKTMAENQGKCFECGAIVTRLIRVHFPIFKSSYSNSSFDNSLIAIGNTMLEQVLAPTRTTLLEKYKNKPWLLEDETGQAQYQGQLEGSQSATYYLLMMQGKEFVAIPAGSWYNFNKVAQYKQLTLEEAEEKMKNRRKTADGYERWMMKAANNGAAAFGEGRKKSTGEEEEGHVSDRGEEDEEEEAAKKNRLGLNKKSGDDDDEGPREGDLDMDDDDVEKAVGNDPEERDLAPEVPAPPKIKEVVLIHLSNLLTKDHITDEDEEDEEQEGGLSKSGKELKKLLGKASGLNDSDADEEDDDEDVDDDMNFNPTPAPKQKDAPKEEPADNSPMKPAPSASARGTPATSKSSKGKRKGDDTKASNGTPLKKVKSEPGQESKTSVKEENTAASKGSAPSKGTSSSAKAGSTSAASASSSKAGSASTAGPVTEEEIRAVLLQKAPVTTSDLVAKFKARLKSPEDKKAFADILRRISKIQKTNGPNNYVVLREK